MTPRAAVLHYLANHGESDGLTVSRAVSIPTGDFYRAILALQNDGEVEGRTVYVAGRPKSVWSATAKGRETARRSA